LASEVASGILDRVMQREELKYVLVGTWIKSEHFAFVKSALLRALDQQDARDILAKLKTTNPEMFEERNTTAKRDDLMDVMQVSGVRREKYLLLKSFVSHSRDKDRMMAAVARFKTTNSEWFE